MMDISGAFFTDVIPSFGCCVVAWACSSEVRGEGEVGLSKVSGICMSCSALKDAAEDFAFVLKFLEVFDGVERGFDSVGYGRPSDFRGVFPLYLPSFHGIQVVFGSSLGVRVCDAERDLTPKSRCFFASLLFPGMSH